MPRRASRELTGAPPPAGSSARRCRGRGRASRDDGGARRRAVRRRCAAPTRSPTPPATRRAPPAPTACRSITVGVDAGRYGVIENARDYDIRGNIGASLPHLRRLPTRAPTRPRRAPAPPTPTPTRIREEAARDAAIAWSDVQRARGAADARSRPRYIASRRSRDVIAERFRAARGTLFDVVAAEDSYFESATAYIQALTELDAARYVLLSRWAGCSTCSSIDADRLRGEG